MLTSVAQVLDALLFLGVAAALLWFVWRLVVRRLYRVWHIRRLAEKREMRELLAHDPRSESHEQKQ